MEEWKVRLQLSQVILCLCCIVRKRWLLVAEAWIFLILTVLDFSSHAAIRASPSLTVFRPLDNVVGKLPILRLRLGDLFFAQARYHLHRCYCTCPFCFS